VKKLRKCCARVVNTLWYAVRGLTDRLSSIRFNYNNVVQLLHLINIQCLYKYIYIFLLNLGECVKSWQTISYMRDECQCLPLTEKTTQVHKLSSLTSTISSSMYWIIIINKIEKERPNITKLKGLVSKDFLVLDIFT
jgi:hypothetical protein